MNGAIRAWTRVSAMGTAERASTPAPAEPIGLRVRRLRVDRSLTQRQLAEQAGISVEAIHTIERGRKYPRRSTVHLLALALGVAIDDLPRATPRRRRRSHGGQAP
jgi:transcriptional regulator with XRE-family HTH domain